jgi:hypothetical protein
LGVLRLVDWRSGGGWWVVGMALEGEGESLRQ